MSEEAELLRRYAEDRSEAAFEEVVRRNLNLVHSAAIRQVGGNSAAAADIAQAVFTEIACQANRLTRHPALVGWLYTTTCRMDARYVRDETRRRRREHEAHAMQETHRSRLAGADPLGGPAPCGRAGRFGFLPIRAGMAPTRRGLCD